MVMAAGNGAPAEAVTGCGARGISAATGNPIAAIDNAICGPRIDFSPIFIYADGRDATESFHMQTTRRCGIVLRIGSDLRHVRAGS
jgi:hypothetical protein